MSNGGRSGPGVGPPSRANSIPVRSQTLGPGGLPDERTMPGDFGSAPHARSEDLNHDLRRPPNRPFASDEHPERPGSASSQGSPSASPGPGAADAPVRSCSACGKPMQGPFVRALGTVFHLNCFKCMDCGDVVASKFFPIDTPEGKQQPLCERDYFRRLNLICAKCGSALRGSYITACNKKFHVEHFTCSLCSTLFGAQDSYYEHDGDVYCHFHYSTRFATKCAGCSSAILKQFVEINRNMRDECWHPECYMINKFWNVKVVSRRPTSALTEGEQQEPAYLEEEQKETAATLKDKQARMEQQVYRIWTVLSAFEESSAACISDMLRQVSNGQYLDAIRMAEKFILHVEVLFATIDDLEFHFARLSLKGMSHVREARMLCRKTVELFTLLSHTQETGSRRMGMTQELLALVTGLAHYLKILIRIALTGALKLEREYSAREAMSNFLDKLHLLAVQGGNPSAKRVIRGHSGEVSVSSGMGQPTTNFGTQGVTYGFRSLAPENAGDSPFTLNAPKEGSPRPSSSPPSDLCIKCGLTVEEDCVRLGTYQRWHSNCVQCRTCGKVAAVPVPEKVKDKEKEAQKNGEEGGKEGPPKLSTARRPPANVGLFVYDVDSMKETSSFGEVPTVMYCTEHGHGRCRSGFQAVPRLEQYAFLLNVALRRLYLLLKKQGVVPVSPGGTPSEASSIADPYRNSTDMMRMKSKLDRKLSATAHTPRKSTIVESPAGRATDILNSQRSQDAMQQAQQPISNTTAQHGPAQQRSPPQIYQSSIAAASGSKPSLGGITDVNGQILRPSFARNNTEVMIVEENQSTPNSPAGELPPGEMITLQDLPEIVGLAVNRRSNTPFISDLNPLELAIVKMGSLALLTRGPLRDQLEMDELLEMLEIKKGGFWNKLFKGDKNKVKKKGVFGVPLELLVEKDGADSVLGASGSVLRIPTFIDDVVSAMRQMDMSVEGIFRKNGNIRRLKDLTDAIDRDASAVDLTTDNSVQLAALLKKFLRDLPDPLLTFKLYRLLCATQSIENPDEKHRHLHLVSLLLPRSHRDTMEVLFVFLKWVASFAHLDEETGSKMDLDNLAITICPSILYARSNSNIREDQLGAIEVTKDLLNRQDEFFVVPGELVPMLRDQDKFANLMDASTRDFFKKCDNWLRAKGTNGPRGPGGSGTPRLQSPAPDNRPGMSGAPTSDRPMRPHPGMPQSSLSYPPPASPSIPGSIPASLQNMQNMQNIPPQQQSRPSPDEQWNPGPPRPPASGNSSSRPTSYVAPRPAPPNPNADHSYSPHPNGYQ